MTPNLARLTCHPDTPTAVVEGITVTHQLQQNRLTLSFVLSGDLARLRIPPQRPPARTDGLWRHTCFEIFLAQPKAEAYREFNFSPSGEWAAYAFLRYREAGPAPECAAPPIEMRLRDAQLELNTEIPLATENAAALQLAFSAVVEERGGRRSYWALHHPPGKPDFHHRDSFALTLNFE